MARNVEALLDALAAGPKPFKVVVRYECGKAREIPCHSRAAAENFASMERSKIGLELLDPMTGAAVQVVSVEVEAAQ